MGGIAQVVGCLPNKHKALSSNLSTEKRKKTNKNCWQGCKKMGFLYPFGGNVN
jgi:hypothetical protein